MSPIFFIVIVSLLFLWVTGLTFYIFRLAGHYNSLVKDTNKRSLQTILETVLRDVEVAKKDIDFLKNKCDTIISDGNLHIQKIGLQRFNPFKDTGGDQSFILALLDANNTGVVVSGLYSRSGTRWYAKNVEKGKGVEHELSDEETKAVKEAKQLHA